MIAETFCAVLGPLFVKVAVAVMVLPGVALGVTDSVVDTSASAATGVGTVTVLFGLGSGVVLVPAAVFVTTPALAVTVALITIVSACPTPKLATVAVAPLELLATRFPPLTIGVPMSVRPVLITSVSVTFSATLGPRFTSVTV
jgi:hypothetical protein